MTVVTIWLEPRDGALWAIADTRISSPGSDGGTTISTDSAAKLFAIPVQCNRPSAGNASFRRLPHYTTSIGFAFAGDVVPATMTVATASTFLQNLTTTGPSDPPSLREVAWMIGRLAARFSKEKLSSSNGRYGEFEAAVFGWCPVLNRFAVYELRPRSDPGRFEIECLEHLPEEEDQAISFGSGAKRLNEVIADIRQNGDVFQRTGRVPKLAVEALIREGSLGDVGGSLSIGLADRLGFRLYAHVTPVVYGAPAAKMCFNGIDIFDEVGPIGHYLIGINGMV
jgi:hypothetical protein